MEEVGRPEEAIATWRKIAYLGEGHYAVEDARRKANASTCVAFLKLGRKKEAVSTYGYLQRSGYSYMAWDLAENPLLAVRLGVRLLLARVVVALAKPWVR